jgi:hypothetical protein
MKYLYGDSVPFPLQYNFLTTLENFVTSATRAVQLQYEVQQVQNAALGGTAARTRTMAELESFHRGMMRVVSEFSAKSSEPQTSDYARQIEEFAARLVEQAKTAASQATEREQQAARGEIDRRRQDARVAVETFLTSARLPTLESKISMRLIDGRNELSAVLLNPNGIMTAFMLNAAQVPEWQGPRRVGDFAPGVDLQIGIKRSWIKRTVQPEVVHLDDFVLGAFELTDDAAEIRLRRKQDQRDTLVFRLQRSEGELSSEVHRLGDDEPDALPTTLDASDRVQVERLWQVLRASASNALDAKQQLVSVQLDGEDVFEHDLLMPLLERIVKFMAPIVTEIERRSPNENELSLKIEDDSGRREEVYLRKAGLVTKLETLSAQERAVFAPLKLVADAEESIPEAEVALED